VRDSSLSLPQGGQVDNRLRTNHPHSQALPECRGSDGGNVMGRQRLVGEKIFTAPSQGGEGYEEEMEDELLLLLMIL
jgi:hypothetical protein